MPRKYTLQTVLKECEELRTQLHEAEHLMGSERVLFVDDEEILAEWGKDVLHRLGYSVTALKDAAEALKLFSKDPSAFDIVVLDQTMPKMTGYMLAQELLKMRPDIPILLCTGHSDAVSPEAARKAGIKEFLMKPLGKEDLATTLRKILHSAEK